MTTPYGLMADLHLHAWSAFSSTTPEGINSRLAGLLTEIGRCAKETKAEGGKRVYMAGDIFHVRGNIQPTVLNATRDALSSLAHEHDIEFVIMPGNHDLEGKESTRLSSAVTALEELGRIRVSDEILDCGYQLLVPWTESVDDLKAKLLRLAEADPGRGETDLIIHAPVDGVIKGLPSSGLDPLWLSKLGFKRVFSGHYHNHKKFGNVYSIGALAHHTWSDIGSKAGFLIVHPDRVDYRKSHLPEFIDLGQLAEIDPDDLPLIVDKNFIRVKVADTKSKVVEAARQELLAMGAAAVIVQAEPKPPAREEGTVATTVASGASLEVSIADFVKIMPGIDIEAVTAAALEVLAAVDASGE